MDKGSVFIAKIKFARDPNQTARARQYLVIMNNTEHIFFLETEKTINKTKFDVNHIAESSKYYYILKSTEYPKHGFKLPTAINCREVFKCDYFTELRKLKHRDIDLSLVSDIISKVNQIRSTDNHLDDVIIEMKHLVSNNPKLW